MGLPAKLIRSQLNFFKPFVAACSLEVTRKGQDKLGELMEAIHRHNVIIKDHPFDNFEGAWIVPREERRSGVVLYLHGGGYACGDLEYAKGFGSTLAAECGVRVFCSAYRLAPEEPYPAALDDAEESYRYLLSKGYTPGQICLCGESAGGGLIYALCLRLKEKNMKLPCGIIAISPWTDLTCSGGSYETNMEKDPSLTAELLHFYSDCYAGEHTPKDAPELSPLFGDLSGMPPSLIFAGGDELLLDDSKLMHEKLLKAGCKSQLLIAPERWHAYVLYMLNENVSDFDEMNKFLTRVMAAEQKQNWLRLDNAAKIYPAALRKNWSNVFRISATLSEPVDREILRAALDVTIRRFPSIGVRLRRGLFWFYLERIPEPPGIQDENSYPLVHMSYKSIRNCAFRVLVYENRIAVEIFHALTDGTGGLIFLKTLVAEYLTHKYGISIPATDGVLGRLEEPSAEELEDSFLKHSGPFAASRKEATAYKLSGAAEPDGFVHLTTFMLDSAAVLAKAHEYSATVTEFLTAAMMQAVLHLEAEQVPCRRLRKPVKVLVPVNLRKLFPSKTLRNFALFVTPEIDPKLGDYSFEEICSAVRHRMGMEVTAKQMSTKIAANVNSEKSPFLKVMPLVMKNAAMKAVFDTVGERKSCLCMSNLGLVKLPEVMRQYVKRMDFIIGLPSRTAYNCALLSYDGTVYINLVRSIREPELEMQFYKVLRELGIHVRVESNQR